MLLNFKGRTQLNEREQTWLESVRNQLSLQSWTELRKMQPPLLENAAPLDCAVFTNALLDATDALSATLGTSRDLVLHHLVVKVISWVFFFVMLYILCKRQPVEINDNVRLILFASVTMLEG
jgi:hypothetical protein